VLDDHTATAPRPAVPPRGERIVIIVIAIAVVLVNHLRNHNLPGTLPEHAKA
jgi:predicted metal-dependent hydrolase